MYSNFEVSGNAHGKKRRKCSAQQSRESRRILFSFEILFTMKDFRALMQNRVFLELFLQKQFLRLLIFFPPYPHFFPIANSFQKSGPAKQTE